jgi:hypothetical protein
LHELNHAVGFYHEQSREDRDEFVDILYDNIQSGFAYAFDKAAPGTTNTFDVRYDYESVMHYGNTYFSRNGQPTIVAKVLYSTLF